MFLPIKTIHKLKEASLESKLINIHFPKDYLVDTSRKISLIHVCQIGPPNKGQLLLHAKSNHN